MLAALWRLSKGYRLQPWNSPYLRWRMETYAGWRAERITPADFRRFMWQNHRELIRFLKWADRMDAAARHRMD
jgi:hypothetical protein